MFVFKKLNCLIIEMTSNSTSPSNTLASKINVTLKRYFLAHFEATFDFSHSQFTLVKLISQICYCGQISLQNTAVNSSFSDNLTPLGWYHLFCWRWYICLITVAKPCKHCLPLTRCAVYRFSPNLTRLVAFFLLFSHFAHKSIDMPREKAFTVIKIVY